MSVTIKLRAIRDANPCDDRWEVDALLKRIESIERALRKLGTELEI